METSVSLVPLDIEIIVTDQFSWRVRSSHFQMGTQRHREGSAGHRARGDRVRAGPTASSPWGWVWGDQPLLQDVSTPHEGERPKALLQTWGGQRVGPQEARVSAGPEPTLSPIFCG